MPTEHYPDKRIWIIGASHGIGHQLAISLAEAGATIIASGRSKDELKKLCQELPVKTTCACRWTCRTNGKCATRSPPSSTITAC